MTELCVAHVGIVLGAYVIFLMNTGESPRKRILGGTAAVLIGLVAGALHDLVPFLYLIVMIAALVGTMTALFRMKPRKTLTRTLVSLGVSYLFYYAGILVLVFFLYLNKVAVADRFEKSIDAWIYVVHFVTTYTGGIMARSCVAIFQFVLLLIMFRIKRGKMLLTQLLETQNLGIVLYCWIAVLMIKTLDMISAYTRYDLFAGIAVSIFVMTILAFQLYSWLKYGTNTSYRIRLKETELILLEKSLHEKDAFIRALTDDNERLAGIIHKDNKLIPSMVISVRRSAENQAGPFCAEEAARTLDGIYSQRRDALAAHDAVRLRMQRTGDTATDALLLSLCVRAKQSGIAFRIEVQTDITVFSDEAFTRSEFNIMLACLAECAIASVRDREGGAVAVRITKSGENCRIEVLDNGNQLTAGDIGGICRELFSSGRSGGSAELSKGIVRDILKRTSAGLTVETPAGDDAAEGFTKAVRVTFDAPKKINELLRKED